MAVYSITQTAGTLEQAERAVMGVLADIVDIPGVGQPEIMSDKDGNVCIAVATIVVPDDVQLDDVQREKLSRYTNLEEKSEELEADFAEAEEGEDQAPQDPIIAAAATNDKIKDMEPNLPAIDETGAVVQSQTAEENIEGDIKVEKSDLGEFVPDPAPEMDDNTVVVSIGDEDKKQAQRERDKTYENKANNQNHPKDKKPDFENLKEQTPENNKKSEPELA